MLETWYFVTFRSYCISGLRDLDVPDLEKAILCTTQQYGVWEIFVLHILDLKKHDLGDSISVAIELKKWSFRHYIPQNNSCVLWARC